MLRRLLVSEQVWHLQPFEAENGAVMNQKIVSSVLNGIFAAVAAGLKIGESISLPLGTQWALELTRTSEGRIDATMYNPVLDAEGNEVGRKFYQMSTVGNPYGAPMIIQEPSLGIPCRDAGIDLVGNLIGFVAFGEDGALVLRTSLSKLTYSPKPEERASYSVSPEGEVVVGGKSLGYVNAVFLPDKNRMQGYAALVRPNRPNGPVKVLEMEQVAFAM
jgi:hypothetical protein